MDKHSKPGTPQAVPSKAIIINWIKSLLPDLIHNIKIQELGQGVIYARILNHFYGNPQLTKISWNPKNQYQFSNNLKHVQTALTQLGLTMSFDVNKISKCKFLENWALINCFYRQFHQLEETVNLPEENSVSSQGNQNNGQVAKRLVRPSPPHFMNHEHDFRIGFNRAPSFSHPSLHKDRQYSPMNSQLGSLAQSSLQLTSYLKQNVNVHNSSPSKGKWSVGSQMLQNNQNAVIDRIKQILLKGSNDTQKVRQIKMLLGMALEDEQIIKIEDDDNGMIVYGATEHQRQDKSCRLEEGSRQYGEDINKESVGKLSGRKLKKPFKI